MIRIKSITKHHLERVLTIEDQYPAPWGETDFLLTLRQDGICGWVAQDGYKVAGYLIFRRGRKRVHIYNLKVDEAYRRRGIASKLLANLTSKLAFYRLNRIVWEVRESDMPVLCFLRKAGFKAVKVLRAYFEDTSEDAYLMRWRAPQVDQSRCLT